jgi:hypothetical protein
LGLGFWGFGFLGLGFEFWFLVFGFWFLGFKVQGFRFMVQISGGPKPPALMGFRVWEKPGVCGDDQSYIRG